MPAIVGYCAYYIVHHCMHSVLWKISNKIEIKVRLQTVDHSVRWSMKNAASCVKRCEMQDTPSTWFLNAYCSLGSFPGLRLSEGRYDIKIIVQVCFEYAFVASSSDSSYTWIVDALSFTHKRFNSATLHVALCLCICWAMYMRIQHISVFYTCIYNFFCRPQIKRDYPLNLSI